MGTGAGNVRAEAVHGNATGDVILNSPVDGTLVPFIGGNVVEGVGDRRLRSVGICPQEEDGLSTGGHFVGAELGVRDAGGDAILTAHRTAL